jgi:hypothetical protein
MGKVDLEPWYSSLKISIGVEIDASEDANNRWELND